MADGAHKIYWRAYAAAVRKAANLPLETATNTPVFIASQGTFAVPGGKNIPDAVTNFGIYSMADSLLKPDSMFYVASKSNSYFQKSRDYLGSVDLQSDANPGLHAALAEAQEKANSTRIGLNKVQIMAVEQWNLETKNGITSDPFNRWATISYPDYKTARDRNDAANATISTLTSQIEGPLAAQITADRAKLVLAWSQDDNPGSNMPATIEDINQWNEYAKRQDEHNTDPIPSPKSIFRVPAYTVQSYKQTIDDWRNMQRSSVPLSKVEIVLDNGSKTTEENLGFKRTEGEGSLFYIPLISIGASGSKEEERKEVKVDESGNDVSFVLTYRAIKTATISPGVWDLGDVRGRYKQFEKYSPENLTELVRPTQLILASEVGLEVTFSGSLKNTLDEEIKKNTNASGAVNLRIFNIEIALSPRHETRDSKVTHDGTWDNSSGSLSVKPNSVLGQITLLGVVGETLSF